MPPGASPPGTLDGKDGKALNSRHGWFRQERRGFQLGELLVVAVASGNITERWDQWDAMFRRAALSVHQPV
jgi:hypothetical protein